jgi:hypothetical protein
LFERALEMLAAHEGIDISPMEPDASRARNDSGG